MAYVTTKPLIEVLKAAYELSQPQGLGFRQFVPGPLSDTDAHLYIGTSEDGKFDFDYVRGRALKLSGQVRGSLTEIRITSDYWFDHTPEQALELILRLEAVPAEL